MKLVIFTIITDATYAFLIIFKFHLMMICLIYNQHDIISGDAVSDIYKILFLYNEEVALEPSLHL